jgi:hypothetical protein
MEAFAMVIKNTDPEFAAKLRQTMKDKGVSQKWLHEATKLSLTTINRIVKDGYGDIDHVAKILNALKLPQNFKFDCLVRRQAELAKGEAKEILKHGLHLYRTTEEYLIDFCPVPLDRAYAAAYYGISFQAIIGFAKKYGITDFKNPNPINTWDILTFKDAFEKHFGKDACRAILTPMASEYPPVVQMDFTNIRSADEYVKIHKGKGIVIFNVPHVVLSYYYDFEESGRMECPAHKGGIEFSYAIQGSFRLIYENRQYPQLMTPKGPILIYDARKQHTIEFIKGDEGKNNEGKLVIVRFYPDKRKLYPCTKNDELKN